MKINTRLVKVIKYLQKHDITEYTFTAFGYTCYIKKNKFIPKIWESLENRKIWDPLENRKIWDPLENKKIWDHLENRKIWESLENRKIWDALEMKKICASN